MPPVAALAWYAPDSICVLPACLCCCRRRPCHPLPAACGPHKPTAHLLPPPPTRRRRLTPQAIKVRADVEMTCFAYDGVEQIKEAMRVAQRCGSQACPVSMKLVAAPRYVLTTSVLDKTQVGGMGGGAGGGAGWCLSLAWAGLGGGSGAA